MSPWGMAVPTRPTVLIQQTWEPWGPTCGPVGEGPSRSSRALGTQPQPWSAVPKPRLPVLWTRAFI